jgi:hypothetical protein
MAFADIKEKWKILIGLGGENSEYKTEIWNAIPAI